MEKVEMNQLKHQRTKEMKKRKKISDKPAMVKENIVINC